MENFIFALNATIPLFLTMLLGWFLQRVKLFNDAFNKTANQYVFKVALPVSLFMSIVKMDFYSDFDPWFCLFCFAVTCVMFLGVWALTWRLMKNRGMIGAFSQASVRSSAALLGVALAVNIYGNAGMVPMMIIAAVPFFNVFAVLILTFSPHVDDAGNLLPDDNSGGSAIKKALKGMATNPIILGILAGLPFALLRITLPTALNTMLTSIGNTASPVGLLVIGAGFSANEALKKWKPAAVSTLIKLVVLPALFIPLAGLLGFRNSQMVAILIMLGSPTTVACYVMAKSMKADGVLTSNIVMLTTLFSSVSITGWLFVMKSLGWI